MYRLVTRRNLVEPFSDSIRVCNTSRVRAGLSSEAQPWYTLVYMSNLDVVVSAILSFKNVGHERKFVRDLWFVSFIAFRS